MSDKLITLVTGANQGIGKWAAQKLAATGKHTVLLGARDVNKAQKTIDELGQADTEALQIDLDSDASINAAAETVEKKYGRLDILVNNAGIGRVSDEKATLREQFQRIFNTNVFGQSVATEAFLPLMRKSTAAGGKRIVFVSSVMGCLTNVANPDVFTGPNILVYPASKTAENALTVFYGNTLGEEGFTVTSICPGYCETNLNGFQGYKDPKIGADPIMAAIESKREDVHKQFVHHDGGDGRYPW